MHCAAQSSYCRCGWPPFPIPAPGSPRSPSRSPSDSRVPIPGPGRRGWNCWVPPFSADCWQCSSGCCWASCPTFG
ncbi:MAG: hypothetical protein DSZ01_03095 [Gammaproteobacteria bacterium]|nr:MAG: hypothetical protein DSZ01_03095 [Gammaproteobacteria bacterium]